jgi:hypothetical protein
MKTILILVNLLFVALFADGQSLTLQLLSSSGEHFTNSFYQLEWTMGELDIDTHSNLQNILSEGFNQGQYSITAVDQAGSADFEIKAFPNPVNDFIQLTIKGLDLQNLEFQITNQSGFVIEKTKITNPKTGISFGLYPYGSYIISVLRNDLLIQSFVVIKN